MDAEDDDFDADIADLLSEENDDILLKKKKSTLPPKSDKKIISKNTLDNQHSKSNKATTKFKSKSGTEFEEHEGNDLLDDLGFNDPPSSAKVGSKQSSKSILDELLGRTETPKIVSPIPTPKSESPKSSIQDEPVFGSYKPSAANVKSRPAARRSVRFQDDVLISKEQSKVDSINTKSGYANPTTVNESTENKSLPNDLAKQKTNESTSNSQGANTNRRRSSRGSDWLGLGSDDFLFTNDKNSDISLNKVTNKSVSPEPRELDQSQKDEINLPFLAQEKRRSANLHFLDSSRKSSLVSDSIGAENKPLPTNSSSTGDENQTTNFDITDSKPKSTLSSTQINLETNSRKTNLREPIVQKDVLQLPEANVQNPSKIERTKISLPVAAPFENKPEHHSFPVSYSDGAAQGTITDLKMKVKMLEMENQQNLKTIEKLHEYHQQEVTAANNSHEKQLKITEEMFKNYETRMKTENELLSKQLTAKADDYEADRKQLIESYQEKLETAHKDKLAMAEKLKEIHEVSIAELKQEHDTAISRLKAMKECEVNAALSSQSHMKSIQTIVEHLQSNSHELSELHTKINSSYSEGVNNKQSELKVKDKQLQELETRLMGQQSEMESERTRLQTLILKLEKRIENEKVSNEEERWKLVQQRNQLSVERESLNQERQLLEERMSRERAQLDKAKQSILDEQKILVEKLCDEHRILASERAQIAGKSKQLSNDEMNQSFKSLKVVAEYEGTLHAVKEESHQLEMQKKELQHEHQKLMMEKQRVKQEQSSFELEKQRINDLALELKKRSQEVEYMCKKSIQNRKEGEKALQQSLSVESEHSQRLESIQKQLASLHEKEKQISKEKQSMKLEIKMLEEKRSKILCSRCLAPISESQSLPSSSKMLNFSSFSKQLSPQLLEWRNLSLQDQQFLEDESIFLRELKNSPYTLSSTQNI